MKKLYDKFMKCCRSVIERKCDACKKVFYVRYQNKIQRFCSVKCGASSRRRRVNKTCVCGKVFETLIQKVKEGKGQYCSKTCFYKSRNKGYVAPSGYRMIRRNGLVMGEHRWFMQDALGRKLRRDETVHHKNGNRQDNRLRNLELWTGNHQRGARITDLRKYLMTIPRSLGGLK